MRRETIWLGMLVGSFVIAGCSSTGPGEFPRDFELFIEDGELDAVEYKQDVGDTTVKRDVIVERERIGSRFAFGGEAARGFFHVFSEEWGATDLFGAGGGVKGAPMVGKAGREVSLFIPYRADLSVAGGDIDSAVGDRSLAYVELHTEVGFGADWKGLRPSVGLAVSSIGGFITVDDPIIPEEDIELSGVNAGFFFDLRYKHKEFPMYAHVRFLTGDYEATTFGIGVNF